MPRYLKIINLFIILILAGCGSNELKISSLESLKGGKTFAVPTGTIADQFVLEKYPDAQIEYYNSVLDCALAVRDGKADAVAYDKPILQNIAAKYEGLVLLPQLLFDDQYGFAVQLQNRNLKQAMDEVLAELKANGTYEDMQKRWFPDRGNPAPMPEIKPCEENGVLKFGTAAVTEPMSFVDGRQQIVGFDIEYATCIARKMGKKLEIVNMEFGALLPALISGKVDMIGAGLSITAERAKKVLFSQSYYPSGIAVLVKSYLEKLPENSDTRMKTLDDIKTKKIGVLLGSIHDAYAQKEFPNAEILEYQNISDMLFALNTGKNEVAFFDQASLPEVLSKNPDLGILAKNVFSVDIAAGFNQKNNHLREQFNSFLQKIRADGTYNDMVDRWIEKGIADMPVIKSEHVQGQLKTGVVSDLGLPFTTVIDGRLVGFDIELSTRFAAYLGKEFVPVDLQFGSLLASVSTNKIDIITSSLMITGERKKQIGFSDPYFKSGVSVIARKKNIATPPAAILNGANDLANKRIGIYTGTIFDGFIEKKYPQAEISRYETSADLVMSVKTGKVDAAMMDLKTAAITIKHNPELGILTDDILSMPLGFGFRKENKALRNQFNAFLKTIRENGTYQTIYQRWFVDDPEKAVMPPFRIPAEGKKLLVGVAVNDLPYVALMNGKYAGFDIELIQKFAEHANYRVAFITMEFSSLVAALATGKVEMIADGIAISEERRKQIDFSDSYAEIKTAIITLNKNMGVHGIQKNEGAGKSVFKSVSDSFYNNIIYEKRYLHIIDGLKVTMIISILAALFGTLIGGLICYMRMSKNNLLSNAAKLYISLLRGTPVLVLLMIIYYVVFASVNINPMIVAVIAFGLNFGAYVSEMFRTSVESIDKGQKEAAIAGGFDKIQTFRYIILPQALRYILPVYKGEFISLIKMTSIVGYIAVQDLTKASDIIRSRTFDAFFPLIMVAVLYLLIAWLLTWLLGFIEFSVDPKRKRTIKLRRESNDQGK